MYANSKTPTSNQQGVHPGLDSVIAHHRSSRFNKPIAEKTRRLFQKLDALCKDLQREIIIDAGCGNAKSTCQLARKHPRALVIGIDRSAARLKTLCPSTDLMQYKNRVLLRADLVDFYLLANLHHWHVKQQYWFYPNPWPKKKHLKRRWHGHALFPLIINLGGRIELRCNWDVYAREFIHAVALLGLTHYSYQAGYIPEQAASPFERKYLHSGHCLYRCVVTADLATKNQIMDDYNQLYGGSGLENNQLKSGAEKVTA